MSYRGDEQLVVDFSGGMVSNRTQHSLALNQAQLVNNIVLTPGGGFRKRNGDAVYNASAMAADKGVTGLAYYKTSGGTPYLMAVCDTKIYKSEMDGTMDDITGSATITSSSNNLWTFGQMNDLAIFVGGAPNTPLKWNASGNVAVLGGSPMSGSFGFHINNRYFIGNSSTYPSRIAWSIIANPEDWSGTGSGSSDIWNNDGDTLVGYAILSNDVVLLFKQNSIHQLIVRAAPFPSYPLIKGVGLAGKNAVTVVGGLAYFITPDAQIKVTDGNTVTNLPDEDIDNILDSLNTSRLPYAQVCRQVGDGYDHILFCVSSTSATTNDICIVWDLTNKCWLYHTTGYKCNSLVLTQDKITYGGHYDGKIYKKDVDATYSDASDGVINGLWRWGWRTKESFMYSSHPFKLTVSMASQTAGNLGVSYGYNYALDSTTEYLDMTTSGMNWDTGNWDIDSWGGVEDIMKTVFIKGTGNTFNLTMFNNTAAQTFKVNGFSIGFKKAAQRILDAS